MGVQVTSSMYTISLSFKRSLQDRIFDLTNRVIVLFMLVRSEADSRDRCNSSDVKASVLKRWKLASCLCPPWWLFKWVHPE
jgi:hypothetical protein